MTIDWSHVLTAIATIIMAIIFKTLLDFRLATFLVKWFHWLPVRNVFRDKPICLAGNWEEHWTTDSPKFQDPKDRHSHGRILQLGRYCYTEFLAQGTRYAAFGQIKGNYFVGDWYDIGTDSIGYFGAFQLQIVDANTMTGKYIGHSTASAQVKTGNWNWRRVG